MALGEACGIAAHLAVRRGVAVRRVPVAELQALLVERRGVITFYQDLPFDDPTFAAFQWLGARGLNGGYRANKNERLTRAAATEKLDRILKFHGQRSTALRDNLESAVDLTQFASSVYAALRPKLER